MFKTINTPRTLFFICSLLLAATKMSAQDQPAAPPVTNPEDLVPPENTRDSTAMAIFSQLKGLKKTGSRPDSIKLQDEQAQQEVQEPFIALMTKAYADSIVLRWAPSTDDLFQYGMKTGYIIRKRLLPGGPSNPMDTIEVDDPSDPKQIEDALRAAHEKRHAWKALNGPVFPYDSAQWAPHFPTTDKYALLAAGATGGHLEFEDVGFAAQASQDRSMFGFTLLAADLSRLAADGLGLRFVDRDVQPGQQYAYQILFADSLVNLPFDELPVEAQKLGANNLRYQRGVVRFDGTYHQPDLREFKVIPGDSLMQLQWPVTSNRQFSGYIIERSSDGGRTYDSLTSNIFISEATAMVDSLGNEQGTFMSFNDAPVPNYEPFHYRITGFDAFADRSEPLVIRGMARDLTAPQNPVLKSGLYLKKEEQIRLIWELPEVPSDFDDLYFEYAYHPDSTFARYEAETLDPRDTVYYHAPAPDEYSHYFRMALVDTAGNVSRSYPVFVNIPDTIPPPVPTGLHARIDSTGEVDIQWNDELLAERGFLGYRVYSSNSLSHEFTQLTVKPVNSNFYIYHVPVETLTEKIYYKVQAVDASYNHSAFSEIIEVAKPDLRPPVTPVFDQIKAGEDHIHLTWTPSPSEDVVSQHIIRTAEGSDEVTQFQLLGAASSYADTSAQVGVIYRYQLQAEDDAGLKSSLSFPLRSKRIDKRRLDAVSNLRIDFDNTTQEVTLNWEYSESDDLKFAILRNLNSEKVKSHKLIPGQNRTFTGQLNKPGTYYYAIKVRGLDGMKSLLSEVVSITVQ